jgi:uncharacterized membrane protein
MVPLTHSKLIVPGLGRLGFNLLAVASLAVASQQGSPAQAAFKVCNQSIALYNVAIGAEINQKFHTEGWWTLPPNSCVTPLKEDLDALKLKYVYIHAITVTGDSAFEGNWDMCVDTRRFKIERVRGQPWNCWVRGFKLAKFKEINTGNAKSWTVFVRGSGQ